MNQQQNDLVIKAASAVAKRIYRQFPTHCKELYGDFSNLFDTCKFYAQDVVEIVDLENNTFRQALSFCCRPVATKIRREIDQYFQLGIEGQTFENKDGSTRRYNRYKKFDVVNVSPVEDDENASFQFYAPENQKAIDSADVATLIDYVKTILSTYDAAHENKVLLLEIFNQLQVVEFSPVRASERFGGSRQTWNERLERIKKTVAGVLKAKFDEYND